MTALVKLRNFYKTESRCEEIYGKMLKGNQSSFSLGRLHKRGSSRHVLISESMDTNHRMYTQGKCQTRNYDGTAEQ